MRRAAAYYIRRGWVPVPLDGKRPIGNRWPSMRRGVDDPIWRQCSGVGLHLGPSGLADVDLDCAEAVELAEHILPETPAKFGRGGTVTHWLYRCPNAEMARLSIRRPPDEHGEERTECLVELRAGHGKQTMCPPSVHPDTGERIERYGGFSPSEVPAVVLSRCVHIIGAACLLMRAGEDWRAVVEAGPSPRITDRRIREWLGWDIPPPPAPPVVRSPERLRSFAEAAREYCAAHARGFPSRRGKCPMCGSPQGFGAQRGAPGRWTCFSARHSSGGIEGRDCWSGDVLDLDAAVAGMSPAEWLRETGYLG